MKKIINYLFETIKKERILLTFIIILFILGLVFGSLFINFVSNDDNFMEQVDRCLQNEVIVMEKCLLYFWVCNKNSLISDIVL